MIDKTELIEFFGVLPVVQDEQEQEFFGSTCFEVSQGDFLLTVSFSSHWRDMLLELRSTGADKPLLRMHCGEISKVEIITDRPTAAPFLRTTLKNGSETLTICLQPHVCIDVAPTA